MRALSTAATGMAAQQLNVEVISNNIANMNTVGFKRQRAEFQDLLYQDVERAGAQSSSNGNTVPTGIQVGAGVKTGSVYRIMDTGSMTATGNQLDLARFHDQRATGLAAGGDDHGAGRACVVEDVAERHFPVRRRDVGPEVHRRRPRGRGARQ